MAIQIKTGFSMCFHVVVVAMVVFCVFVVVVFCGFHVVFDFFYWFLCIVWAARLL